MTDGDVSGQAVQHLLVENLIDQTEIGVDEYVFAVTDRDTGRFLAPVLQRIEAEVRELADVFTWSVDAEDPALIVGLVERRGHRWPLDKVSSFA